jgi:hypothetical protein
MWRYLLLLVVAVLLPAFARCDSLQFTVPSGDVGNVYSGPGNSVDLFSSSLDGTVLSGQTIALDAVLTNSDLARITAVDPGVLGIELIIYTNAGSAPGFAGATTGFLVGPNGAQFGGTQTAGRSDDTNGSFSLGLVSFTSANLDGSQVFDVSGADFDTTLPPGGYVVTNVELVFTFNSKYNSVEFGTLQQLPEPRAWLLLLLGLTVVVVAFCAGIRRRTIAT